MVFRIDFDEESVVFGDCSSFSVRTSERVVEMLASAVVELLGRNLDWKDLGTRVVVDSC